MINVDIMGSFKDIIKIAFNVAFGYSMGKLAACAAQGIINVYIYMCLWLRIILNNCG